MAGPTLIRPPPIDPSKSLVENVLELIPLSDIGSDLFTNARELWHPPGARGVYGGAVIAQCLSAAQATVPPPSPANNHAVFLIHSMHCYFVLAGDSSIPILYHVERIREGKSFLTRTVQARQRGKCIFTTTLSFMREASGGQKMVEHGVDMPEGVKEGLEDLLKGEREVEVEDGDSAPNGEEQQGPFVSRRLGIQNQNSSFPHARKPQAWLQCRGTISPPGGHGAHLSALAYMSDSWFIGTVSRIHNLHRFAHHATASSEHLRSAYEMEKVDMDMAEKSQTKVLVESPNSRNSEKRAVGMMVSLDHTIYFHRPMEVRADQWLCSEMDSPWSGDGRGLVMQRIWNMEGRLVATCVQEGLVRLKQDAEPSRSKL